MYKNSIPGYWQYSARPQGNPCKSIFSIFNDMSRFSNFNDMARFLIFNHCKSMFSIFHPCKPIFSIFNDMAGLIYIKLLSYWKRKEKAQTVFFDLTITSSLSKTSLLHTKFNIWNKNSKYTKSKVQPNSIYGIQNSKQMEHRIQFETKIVRPRQRKWSQVSCHRVKWFITTSFQKASLVNLK